MQIIQTRRDFLASASLAAAAPQASSARGASLADEGPPETTTIRLPSRPTSASRLGYIAEELLRAEGFTDIRYVPDTPVDAVARGEHRLRLRDRRMGRLPSGCRRADHGAGGRAFRLLRAVRARAHPSHQRPEGQAGRHPRAARLERAPAPRDHGGAGRARPSQRTSTGSPARPATPWSCSPQARSMPFSASPRSRRSCAPARSVA